MENLIIFLLGMMTGHVTHDRVQAAIDNRQEDEVSPEAVTYEQ